MLIARHHDAVAGASCNVDMRVDAALADQAQARQSIEHLRLNPRSLTDQHQGLGLLQARNQAFAVLFMIIPDLHLMRIHQAKTGQRADGIEIIVKDGDSHG